MIISAAVAAAVTGARGARDARADADEASVHVQAVGGLAVVGDDAAAGATTTAPLAGVAGRFSYATRDWFQYDAAVTLAATASARFDAGTFPRPGAPALTGAFELAQQLARVDVGVTLRGGVRVIPTLRLAIGAQARRTGAATLLLGAAAEEVRDASIGVDLVGTAAVGLDYRVNHRTIVGVAVGGSYAVPLGGADYRSVEATVFWSHYWYPRW